ncbi:excisionase [Streptomyces sp. NPDC059568]|uniref:excisionase n=1 Tax=Streptomyces sp. NPDC059568 TaxID=3346868 RepID=UPI0036900AC3
MTHTADRLLTVDEAAERLGTGVRFVRRLVAERRIAFVKVGRHVRVSRSVLDSFIETNAVQPAVRRTRARNKRAA